MALIKLSNREMVKLGQDLLQTGGKQREKLDAVDAARALIPTLESSLSLLVLSEAPTNSEIARLTSQLTFVDGRHDSLVRAIDGRCEAEQDATTDPEVHEIMAQVRLAVFLSGRSIIVASYMEEAGEVRFREARVTPAIRKVLKKLKTYEGRTLEELYDELQAVATEIGVLEKRRQELGEEGEIIVKNRAARFQWIRGINALIAVLESQGIDPNTIIGPIREAEAKAERRGGASTGGGTNATNSNATGTNATDTGATDTRATDTGATDTEAKDVLDPPVPTDVADPVDAES